MSGLVKGLEDPRLKEEPLKHRARPQLFMDLDKKRRLKENNQKREEDDLLE